MENNVNLLDPVEHILDLRLFEAEEIRGQCIRVEPLDDLAKVILRKRSAVITEQLPYRLLRNPGVTRSVVYLTLRRLLAPVLGPEKLRGLGQRRVISEGGASAPYGVRLNIASIKPRDG